MNTMATPRRDAMKIAINGEATRTVVSVEKAIVTSMVRIECAQYGPPPEGGDEEQQLRSDARPSPVAEGLGDSSGWGGDQWGGISRKSEGGLTAVVARRLRQQCLVAGDDGDGRSCRWRDESMAVVVA